MHLLPVAKVVSSRKDGTCSLLSHPIKAPSAAKSLSQSKALQHENMFLTNPYQLGAVLLLLTRAMVEAQDLECCPEKRVGSITYTLLSGTFDGELPRQCLKSCVYTVSDTSSPMFCFAKGLSAFV